MNSEDPRSQPAQGDGVGALRQRVAELEKALAESHETAEQLRVEIALRKSEEKYRAYITHAPFGVFVVDARGNYQEANEAACTITGYSEAELCTISIANLVVPDPAEQARVGADFQNLAQNGRVSSEAWLRHKDGRKILISVDAVRIEDDRFIGFCADITEHRSMEAQLRHSQKLECLGVLAGGIAHDFNNLLMGILANAEMALVVLSPASPADDNLQDIVRASERAAELANQMLAYSGKGRFIVKPIDISVLVKETAQLLKVSISKKATLRFDLAENQPSFDGDETQISQVIMNMITNASEAIGDGGGVITLSTGAMDCDRAYLDGVNEVLLAGLEEPLSEGVYSYCEVADTGCGMDAQTIEKIFDPFFTTKFTGRGLGMSAVLGIVRGHRGGLEIHSEVGKGSNFRVLFPANEPLESDLSAAGLPENHVPASSENRDGEKNWRGFGTVLIADDEEVILVAGERMLEGMGFSVLKASDGREALKVFAEHADEIVAVLLDLTMPNMDGEEAFCEFKRLYPDLKIILCSGYSQPDVGERFTGRGLAGFMHKPFGYAELRETLMSVLP